MITKNRRSRFAALSLFLVLVGRTRTHTAVLKEKKIQTPVMWPTLPGLGGLSARSDLTGGITS